MAAETLCRGGCDNKKLTRAALAAALLCGFCWGMPVHSLATESWQYVAFADDDDPIRNPDADGKTWTMTVGNQKYTYHRVTVTDPNEQEKSFWVRDGYHIVIENQERYNTNVSGYPSTDYVIRVYRNIGPYLKEHPDAIQWEDGDEEGLLSTTKVVNWDMGSEYITSNGYHLQKVEVHPYAGASMAGTAVPTDYCYMIYDGNNWVDVGGGKFNSHFKEVKWTDQGYMYNGKLVDPSNVYIIRVGEKDMAGVFTIDEAGETVYEGAVYGKNNEILLTGIDANGEYHSFWGGERNDPNAEIGAGGLTYGGLNTAYKWLYDNDGALHMADIKDLTVTPNETEGQGGTIGLVNNAGKEIGNGVTVTSTGGIGGSGVNNDVKIEFSNMDTDGTKHSFTVNAGTKVEAITDGSTTTLTGVRVNGQDYMISSGGGSDTGGASQAVSSGKNVEVTGGGDTAYVVNLKDNITLDGENGTQVNVNGDAGTISATNNISGGSFSTGKITINGTDAEGNHTGTIDGLSNTTWNDAIASSVAANKNGEAGVAATQGQLQQATAGLSNQITNNTQNISYLQNSVNKLDNRIDRVGAGAAALAALHPQDFDPDAKWDFAAGYGNYRGASATAIGAFYRPNEDVMISVGGAFGGGENMVNAGLSFKIGRGASNVTNSRTAMAKEIKDLREAVAKQDAQIRQLTALVQTLAGVKTDAAAVTDFPDVPENHWAYEAVHDLARRGLVEGYPDGSFGGDRTLTRYEFAQIVYNALQKGAAVDSRLVDEFSPELTYFRIDTVETDDAGQPVIQRVRANRV